MDNHSDDPIVDEEFYFQWHLTQRCNLRCRHCYQSNFSTSNELPLEKLFYICDLLDHTMGVWKRKGALSLTGGEPFLRKDDLFQLIHYIDNKPNLIYFDLLTNGTMINGADIERLRSSKKLRRVQLSLEGPTNEVNDYIRGLGSFTKICEVIRLLKSYDLQVAIMMTLSRHNVALLPRMVSFLNSLEVDAFSVERLIPEGQGEGLKNELLTKEEVREAFNFLHQTALKGGKPRILLYRPLFALLDAGNPTVGAVCSVGNNALTIMHDGTVYPCRRLPIQIGNIFTDGLFKIWYSSQLLWEIRDCRNLKGKCSGCEYITLCRGCRAMAYFFYNDYLMEDPQCWR